MESVAERVPVYAVVFAVRGQEPVAGSLRFTESGLVLSGGNGHRRADVHVKFDDLEEVRIGRRLNERLNGHPTLVLARRRRPAVLVIGFGAGLLHEITELLAKLTADRREDTERLVVRVPLRPGVIDRVRELLLEGPPIDPSSLGLASHEVYLRDSEALFVFTGHNVRTTVRKAARRPALWRAGIAWRDLIAGQPTIEDDETAIATGGEAVYTWARP